MRSKIKSLAGPRTAHHVHSVVHPIVAKANVVQAVATRESRVEDMLAGAGSVTIARGAFISICAVAGKIAGSSVTWDKACPPVVAR